MSEVYTKIAHIYTNTGKEVKVVDSTGRIIHEASRLITVIGVPPISFTKSIGKPLISWSMLGNAQQTGTPSPNNIIMPEMCGVRTGNLFNYADRTDIINGMYISKNGEIVENASYYISYPINIETGVAYTWRFNSEDTEVVYSAPTVGYYDNNDTLIGVAQHPNGIKSFSFTVPTDCKYIRCSVNQRSGLQSEAMLNSGSTALPYEPYGYKIPITCAGQTVPVYLGQVNTVRRIYKMRLLNPASTTQTANGYRLQFSISGHQALPYSSSSGFCNIAQWNGDYSRVGFVVSNAYAFITQNIPEWATVEGAKAWLEENEVYVWYVLATPQTGIVNEPLAKIGDYADELHSTDAGVTIPTARGNNTLTVDTDLPPSSMTIVYKGKP